MQPLVKVRGLFYGQPDGTWAYHVFLEFYDGTKYSFPSVKGFTKEESEKQCNEAMVATIAWVEMLLAKDDQWREHKLQMEYLH